jgi:sugar O-acyltransferase (sialic acid O-acetyltransferase NeuD family)
MINDERKIICLGSGGHAKVLNEIIELRGKNIWKFLNVNEEDEIFNYKPNEIILINGIGYLGKENIRKRVYEKFSFSGYEFLSLIHPSAVASKKTFVYNGYQIMANATIQANVELGMNSIINSAAIIEHDVVIGDHVHICPGVTICGGVAIDDETFIGANSTIIQGVKIGSNVTIGAGSVVIKDVKNNAVIVGNPGRIIRYKEVVVG